MSGGLPGLRGIEHVGITVPDWAAAADFFVRVLGCRFVLDGGVVADPALNARQLGVHPAASMRWGFLRCGHGPNIEVFEYQAPEQAAAPPRNSDIGGHHLAIYVDDIAAAIAHLRGHGIAVEDDEYIADGPAEGSRWTYFKTPWGLQLELVSYPQAKGAADSPARLLWHPAYPER